MSSLFRHSALAFVSLVASSLVLHASAEPLPEKNPKVPAKLPAMKKRTKVNFEDDSGTHTTTVVVRTPLPLDQALDQSQEDKRDAEEGMKDIQRMLVEVKKLPPPANEFKQAPQGDLAPPGAPSSDENEAAATVATKAKAGKKSKLAAKNLPTVLPAKKSGVTANTGATSSAGAPKVKTLKPVPLSELLAEQNAKTSQPAPLTASGNTLQSVIAPATAPAPSLVPAASPAPKIISPRPRSTTLRQAHRSQYWHRRLHQFPQSQS